MERKKKGGEGKDLKNVRVYVRTRSWRRRYESMLNLILVALIFVLHLKPFTNQNWELIFFIIFVYNMQYIPDYRKENK